MLAMVVAPAMNERRLLTDEDRHQNVKVPGPVTVVCRVEEIEALVTVPLCTALTPSCVVVFCTDQKEPDVVQVSSGALSAIPSWAWESVVRMKLRKIRT